MRTQRSVFVFLVSLHALPILPDFYTECTYFFTAVRKPSEKKKLSETNAGQGRLFGFRKPLFSDFSKRHIKRHLRVSFGAFPHRRHGNHFSCAVFSQLAHGICLIVFLLLSRALQSHHTLSCPPSSPANRL